MCADRNRWTDQIKQFCTEKIWLNLMTYKHIPIDTHTLKTTNGVGL